MQLHPRFLHLRNLTNLSPHSFPHSFSQPSLVPLQAVCEIIMLERMLDGVVKGEYSLGWALLPLFRVAGAQPGLPAGVALDPQPGRPLSVPLVSGTPRYLLFRCVWVSWCV
jgi:hypothetical protein